VAPSPLPHKVPNFVRRASPTPCPFPLLPLSPPPLPAPLRTRLPLGPALKPTACRPPYLPLSPLPDLFYTRRYEACRIRLVSQPDYAPSLMATAKRMSSEMGFVTAFYSGFVPILFKQVPYTMAKFLVQGLSAEKIVEVVGKPTSESGKVSVSLASGVIAGVVSAIISHPADTLLSKMNKGGAGGKGGMFSRMGNIAAELGLVNLCTTGLAARCIMIGTLTAGQFGVFDVVMNAVGAKKFHFHDPSHH